MGILSHVSRTIRWNILLEPLGYKPKIKNTFLALMIGYFANLAFPRIGEVTRCGILNKYEKIPMNKSLGTVITERALDLLIFAILFFVTLFLQFDNLKGYVNKEVYAKLSDKYTFYLSSYFLIRLGIVIIVIALVLFFIRKRIYKTKLYQKILNIFLGFWEGLSSLAKIKKPFWFIFHTLVIWILYYLMLYVCFFSLPETSGLGFYAALSAFVFGTIGIMVTPGGIGLYPAIIKNILGIYQISKASGFALGWIAWSAQTLMVIIAGLIALILLPILNKEKPKEEEI